MDKNLLGTFSSIPSRQIFKKGEMKREQATIPIALAGADGIEPPNAGVKVPCLTAWLNSYIKHIIVLEYIISLFF